MPSKFDTRVSYCNLCYVLLSDAQPFSFGRLVAVDAELRV